MRPQIVSGNIYHVLSRGVDGRVIFVDDNDYLRFIHDLFEFNDSNSAPNNNRRFSDFNSNSKSDAAPNLISFASLSDWDKRKRQRESRVLLVELLVFCLMPNHYHLMVRPRSSESLTLFMRKLNMGYANYFNLKYERKGTLFQSRYKSVAVTKEAHFIHLPFYIHCNALDLFAPGWRGGEIKDYKTVFTYLENYRWSSFPDYIGKKNFPSITQREFLLDFFDGPEEYKKSMLAWLKDMDVSTMGKLLLE